MRLRGIGKKEKLCKCKTKRKAEKSFKCKREGEKGDKIKREN